MNATSRHRTTPSALYAACALCCLLAALRGGSGVLAGEESSVAGDVDMVKPFIGETTILVIKVDPTRLALPDLSKMIEATVPKSRDAYRAWMQEAAKGIETLRTAAGGPPGPSPCRRCACP